MASILRGGAPPPPTSNNAASNEALQLQREEVFRLIRAQGDQQIGIALTRLASDACVGPCMTKKDVVDMTCAAKCTDRFLESVISTSTLYKTTVDAIKHDHE